MRRRLVLVAAATTTMVALAFVVPLALLVRTLAAERALTGARQVASALAPSLAAGTVADIELVLAVTSTDAPGPVTVVLPDGRLLGDVTVTSAEVSRALAGEAFTEDVPQGRDVVTPVVGETGGISVVHVRIPTDILRAGVAQAWGVLGALGVVLVLGAVLVSDRLGRSVVRPVGDVADAARQLAAGDRHARAPIAGPPEIADVGAALNGLADRIDDLRAAEREAAADLSHRLRTPLTALRLDVDALPDGPEAERLAADVRALEDTVSRVIRAARSGTTSSGPADIAAIVADRLAFWQPLAEDEGRRVDTAVVDGRILVKIGAEDLEAAIDALVGNVFLHTPPGTAMGIVLEPDDDHVALVVHDGGPGLATGTVTTRGRSGAESTGLGLDICRQLAEDAGGTLVLGTGPLGGASVRLVLPTWSPR